MSRVGTKYILESSKRINLLKNNPEAKKVANIVVSEALEPVINGIEAHIQQNELEHTQIVETVGEQLNTLKSEFDQKLATIELTPGEKGDKGDKGEMPIAGIDYEIPKDGQDYILKEEDKIEIASKIKVPIVEKVIEKTEIIKEIPIVQEVAKYEEAEQIATKLNTLTEKVEIKVIKGLEKRLDTINKNAKQTHGGGLTSVSADIVSNTPAGNISSTNVQDALNELDAEKASIASLASYVPYTGATTDVDLGTHSLTVSGVVLPTVFVDTKEPTGFVDPSGIVSTYDATARTITLTHAGGIDYYWHGVKATLASPWTCPTPHAVLNTKYFLYSTDGINFTWSTSVWNFYDLQIAFVNYGAINKYGRRETHGLMQWQAHEELHDTIGTYLDSGGDLTGIVLASTTAAERRPIVSSTTVQDEDLQTVIATLTSSLYTKHYVAGAGATSTYVVNTADIVPLLVNNPYYNKWDGAAWIQTLMANNSYMAVWLIAFPSTADTGSQSYRYIWVQGQTNGTLAQIQSLTTASLNLGQMASENPEFVFIGKVIIRYTGGNWVVSQVDKLTGSRFSQVSLIGGVSGYVSKAGDTMTGDLRGTDFVKTRSSVITRDINGYITKIVKTGGRTIDYTRDISNFITSYTDGVNTWTLTRDISNFITDVVVT